VLLQPRVWSTTLRRRIADDHALIRVLAAVPRGLLVGGAAAQLVASVLPLGFALASSYTIGKVPGAVRFGTRSAAWHDLVAGLMLTAVMAVLSQLLVPAQRLVRMRIQRAVDTIMNDRLLAACLATAGTAVLDRPEFATSLEDAVYGLRSWRRSPGAAAGALITVWVRFTVLGGTAVLIAVAFSWWAAVLVLAAGMGLRVAHWIGYRRFLRIVSGQALLRRRGFYLRDLGLSAGVAKEARIFGLARWLAERYARVSTTAGEPVWAGQARIYIRPFVVAALAAAAATGAVVAVAGWQVAHGTLSLVDLSFTGQAVLSVLGIGQFFEDADVELEYGARTWKGLQTVEDIMARARQAEQERVTASGTRDGTGRAGAERALAVREEICFENVWFAYPGQSESVLRGVDLRIEAGTSVALVGLNGAGKTTLISLLCRFLEPGEGRITVDGTDLREADPRRWQRQVAAIFQDFGRYELSASDNIGFGAAERLGDDAAIRAAAERAGADGFVDLGPDGDAVVLSKHYPGGSDLSGGQWQRLALARALLATGNGASVLVLDEPTASLDVRAEAEFISGFLDLTRGLTTIVVSHRFATVSQADRVVVLDGGVITEDGSHEELVAAGGTYAELFALQAARFEAADADARDGGAR
jgi:ATP-binding cassette, subfamily B, bacterial